SRLCEQRGQPERAGKLVAKHSAGMGEAHRDEKLVVSRSQVRAGAIVSIRTLSECQGALHLPDLALAKLAHGLGEPGHVAAVEAFLAGVVPSLLIEPV